MGMYYVLGFLFLGYLLGIAFSNKPFSFLVKLFQTDFVREQSDRAFILITLLITFSVFTYFWFYKNNLGDAIQLGIFLATFFTLMFSVLIKDIPSKFRDRPKPTVIFESNDTDFYHKTTMDVSIFNNKGEILIKKTIPTYYVRLKIKNDGKQTLTNTEVVLEDVNPRTSKPFMSLNLNWAGFNVKPNDIKRSVDIPRGQSRTLDVFEFMEFVSTRLLFDDLEARRVSDAVRFKELSEGFRSCTIKPLTRSDIFPRGSYQFRLGIYADGVGPKFLTMSVEYDGNWLEETTDEEMRSEHLKVEIS